MMGEKKKKNRSIPHVEVAAVSGAARWRQQWRLLDSNLQQQPGCSSDGRRRHGCALLPARALAVALVAVDEVQRNDLSQQDLLEEDPASDLPFERLARSQRQRKDVETCAWAQLLEDKDLEDSTSITAKQFRVDFRVPYTFFLRLVALVKSKNWFLAAATDAVGRASHPVEHKVLAWLTILGRNNCFASIFQVSWMSAKTVQGMFHKFCRHFARDMYDEHIHLLAEESGKLDHVVRSGWVYGCPYNQARSYTGKEGFPTIAYQVVTIVCWDAAVEKIRTDKQYTEKTFDVYNEDGTTTTLKGWYLLVDNGYHKWQILIEPSKYPLSENDLLFSKRLDSVRRDGSASDGILKGRFRILKLAMAYQSQERIDDVFFTCCIMHNMLHTFDGMDQLVENTIRVSSAGVGATLATELEADCGSVGRRDVNDQPQLEIGRTVRKRQLTTSFAYRKKHKKDIVWLSR
ncbi:unnamed protein product [Ectocarpus sp. CCAP 1310/34]|nr:unnamed protein product [Ectocarpus sp. CCAP 1310/34]